MTVQKIEQEITARIEYIEKKKYNLVIREILPRKMRELEAGYDKELDALYAARRGIRQYYPASKEGGADNAV